ncbi:MAG: fumarate reductase/succinate dehydrogenase flavoprotein-like protein [Thermoleophilia bacterium]|nr:fumarate reductase/succinate dehydrogenase flavoprotein-like protein [Thermoleophilia bacterium]MCZ4495699.1 fumarate reductase/succinate dehydrogenase flavoprotein-like protein [Thermoleophilia bacterium]
MTAPVRRVAVVGAGLAGLSAAVAAHEVGAEVVVIERASRPGGATAQSAGWIWRYNDLATYRLCAPHGDAAVQERVVHQLDRDLEWLLARGVRAVERRTARTFTSGMRVDPRQLVEALAARLPDDALRLRTSVTGARPANDSGFELRLERQVSAALPEPEPEWLHVDAIVFAGGGYAGDLARVARDADVTEEVHARWLLRTDAGGDGTSIDAVAALGAAIVPHAGECFCRVIAPGTEHDEALVRGVGELLVPEAVLRTSTGEVVPRESFDWSGSHAVWQLATMSGDGWLELPRSALRTKLPAGTVEDVLRRAGAGGALVEGDRSIIRLAIAAGITHTIPGIRVDAAGAVLAPTAARRFRERTAPIPGLHAAGCDAFGTGAGGYASGLAQALVLGRAAGTSACS